MVAAEPSRDDPGMNALPILLLVVIPAALALATRRIGGSDGLGLVELFEVALSPFVGAPAAHAVPEPDFVAWRFEQPRTARTVAPRASLARSDGELSTAA
jgi:hypothetical protein